MLTNDNIASAIASLGTPAVLPMSALAHEVGATFNATPRELTSALMQVRRRATAEFETTKKGHHPVLEKIPNALEAAGYVRLLGDRSDGSWTLHRKDGTKFVTRAYYVPAKMKPSEAAELLYNTRW